MSLIQSLPSGFFNIDLGDVIYLLLTLALVVLYWKMYKFQEIMASIQHKQTDIMEKQANFMEANHQPILDVEDITGDEDTLNISLKNRGNGPARNLLVQCVVYKQSDKTTEAEVELRSGYRGEGSILAPQWNRLWRKSAPEIRADGGSQDKGPYDGIEIDDPLTRFESDLTFKYMALGSGNYEVTFSDALDRVSREWDCEYIALDFHIAITDITRQVYAQSIGSLGNVPIDAEGTFEDAIEGAQIGAPIGEPVSEDEVASMLPIDADKINFG
ncbi:hypothetical protein [Natronorubrum texcoconense]|uniref:Uncharacterized protein n=1 Tax=Natronorubrum texcoconense TaxID=1095776 RepID=A0A1G9AL17_9EURY|nr:hypothetical protein [Natronorubrum texcoconense]SDK27524.1 hypothetical protein SAMN04515672_2772 [Natronorubrum texcoconense]